MNLNGSKKMPTSHKINTVRKPHTAPANLSKRGLNKYLRNKITKNARERAHKLIKNYKLNRKLNPQYIPVSSLAKTLKLVPRPRNTGVKNGTHKRNR